MDKDAKRPEQSIASDHQSSQNRTHQIASGFMTLAISAGILAVSLGIFLWLGKPEAPARKKPPKQLGVTVKTTPVELHRGPVRITTNGVVVPFREISIAAEVSGRIVEQSANLRAGCPVTKGEPLIRIDPTEFRIQVRRLETIERQAKAELAALDVSVENTQQLLALSQEELELQRKEMLRIERLQRNDASSTAEIEAAKRAELLARTAVVRIQNTLRDASANRTLLEEKLKLTEVELERARLDEQRTLVCSPVDGRVAMCTVEEQAFVTSGQAFATIEDVSAMEVRSNLTMDEMHWLWVHRNEADEGAGAASAELPEKQGSMAVTMLASSPISAVIRCSIGGREYEWDALFRRVDGSGIDDNTRTVPCLFRVDHPDSPRQISDPDNPLPNLNRSHTLMRGMFATVEIETLVDRDLFCVPNESIRPGKRIWLNDNGELRIASVGVVSRSGELTVIESNEIAAGQSVITTPVPNARQGLPLKVGQGKKPPGVARDNLPRTPGNVTTTQRTQAGNEKAGPRMDHGNPPAGRRDSSDRSSERRQPNADRVSNRSEVGS